MFQVSLKVPSFPIDIISLGGMGKYCVILLQARLFPLSRYVFVFYFEFPDIFVIDNAVFTIKYK